MSSPGARRAEKLESSQSGSISWPLLAEGEEAPYRVDTGDIPGDLAVGQDRVAKVVEVHTAAYTDAEGGPENGYSCVLFLRTGDHADDWETWRIASKRIETGPLPSAGKLWVPA